MSSISRANISALLPEDYSREIFKEATEQSTVLQLGRRLTDLSRETRRVPVLSVLPTAYFVNANAAASDTRRKKLTHAEWKDVSINAEELAVIVPMPINVVEDLVSGGRDLAGELVPLVAEAFGATLDRAVFYGENAPNAWPDDILTSATSVGNVVTQGADVYADLFAEDGLVAKLEQQGYFPSGYVGAMKIRAILRSIRDDKEPVFKRQIQDPSRYSLDGEDIIFPRNGGVDPEQSLLIGGDWNRLVYAVRRDVEWKLFDTGVIQDPSNNSILHNLLQDDMQAIRFTFRLGWQVPNPVNRLEETEANRFPFAVYAPEST